MVNPNDSPEMPTVQKNPTPSAYDDAVRQGRVAIRLGCVGAACCGLLMVAILVTTVWGLSLRRSDEGGAMGMALTFIIFIPMAALPIGTICLVGVIYSRHALRKGVTRNAFVGMRLAVVSPIAVVACYAICLLILLMSGF